MAVTGGAFGAKAGHFWEGWRLVGGVGGYLAFTGGAFGFKGRPAITRQFAQVQRGITVRHGWRFRRGEATG